MTIERTPEEELQAAWRFCGELARSIAEATAYIGPEDPPRLVAHCADLLREVRELRERVAQLKAVRTPRGWWALAAAMSDLSEDHYCAGWMQDCEYDFWRMVQGGERGYGFGEVSQRDINMLRDISAECGGWVRWSSEEPCGREFIPIKEWILMFEKYEQARAAESAAGGEGGK